MTSTPGDFISLAITSPRTRGVSHAKYCFRNGAQNLDWAVIAGALPTTPVTPMTPAWQEESALGVTPLPPSTPAQSDMGQSTCSNSSVALTQSDSSHVISKAISSTVQQCLNISTTSQTSASTFDSSTQPPAVHPSQKDSCCVSNVSAKGASGLPQGGTSSGAKDPLLHVSNVRALGDVSNVRVYSTNPHANGKVQSVKFAPTHDMNETYTFNPKMVENAKKLSPKDTCARSSPAPAVRTVNYSGTATVTKERPSVNVPVVDRSTVARPGQMAQGDAGVCPHSVNSGTITKTTNPLPAVPSRLKLPALSPADVIKMIQTTTGLKETPTSQGSERHTSVVRAFNFESMPGPDEAGQ